MIRLSISHGRFAHSMRIIFILLAHVRSSYTLDRTRTYSTYIWQLLFQHSNMRKCEWESQIFLIFVKFRFCYQFFQIKRALALVQHDGISVNIWTSFVLNISRIFTNQIQIKFLLEVFKQIIKVCSFGCWTYSFWSRRKSLDRCQAYWPYDCKSKELSMWNEAWDQRLEPDRIEVSQPDRLDSAAIIKKMQQL